jgi:hypothetical protein
MLIFDKRFTIIISLYKIIHNITGPPHPTMHRGSSTPFVRVAHVQQLHVVRPSCPCTIAPCPFIRAAHARSSELPMYNNSTPVLSWMCAQR